MSGYRGFPKRLHHEVPNWVEPGALFHIRVAIDRAVPQRSSTDQELGTQILKSARFYESWQRWYINIFVLMPDHLHALLSFGREESMSQVVRNWKRFHAREHRVRWKENYFDHRLRDDERGEQLLIKMDYIRQNPVVSGLCPAANDWP